MQSTLIILVLLLHSVIVQSQAPSQYDVKDMCTRSRNRYLGRMSANLNLFSNWRADLRTVDAPTPQEKINSYFYQKPVDSKYTPFA